MEDISTLNISAEDASNRKTARKKSDNRTLNKENIEGNRWTQKRGNKKKQTLIVLALSTMRKG